MMKKVSRLVIVCLAVAALAACGDSDEDWDELSNGGGGTDAGHDAGPDADSGDADSGHDGGSDADSGPDADGGDDTGPPPAEGTTCADPTDLGELNFGVHTVESTLLEPHDSLDTSCEQDEAGSGVRVFSFEAAADARLQIWSTVSPSQYDLRAGGCDAPDEILSCTTRGSEGADIEQGQTYHLVLWGDLNQGDFELELELEELLCAPDAPDWCENGQMNECRSSTRIETAECIDDCADGSACTADACAEAIDIDLEADSQVSASGHLAAYSNTWNASDLGDGQCSFAASSSNPDTSNAETFFRVQGLMAGQTLTVESLQSGDFAFFVLDSCGADTCLAAVDDDDFGDQRMEWQVPEDGSYTVVVEPLSSRERAFEFGFAVE